MLNLKGAFQGFNTPLSKLLLLQFHAQTIVRLTLAWRLLVHETAVATIYWVVCWTLRRRVCNTTHGGLARKKSKYVRDFRRHIFNLVKVCTSTLWVSKDHRGAWKTGCNAAKRRSLAPAGDVRRSESILLQWGLCEFFFFFFFFFYSSPDSSHTL